MEACLVAGPAVSIIIPCRHRWRNAALCSWSIDRSAEVCGIDDYEIIVVYNGPCSLLGDFCGEARHRLVQEHSEMPVLNKPCLHNLGIKVSRGDVLTFLDADALVGRRWMENVARLNDPTLTKLCYRVRSLPEDYGDMLFTTHTRAALLDAWFARYDHWKQLHEGYGLPERNHYGPGVCFGNSHFSIRRDTLERLGNLRYNEEYIGRGHEDLWMIRELWKRNPDNYHAEIVTDSDHAVFNIDNGNGGPGGRDWYVPNIAEVNRIRYNTTWDGMKKRLLNEMSGGDPRNLPPDVALELLEPEIAN